jgi:peptide chain release factor 1
MLALAYKVKHIPIRPYTRIYSAASARPSQSSSKALSVLDILEQDGARILRTVQKRVEERANLLAQMSEDMSSPEDIKRVRQIRELEPLQLAWDEWETNQQVRPSSCVYASAKVC